MKNKIITGILFITCIFNLKTIGQNKPLVRKYMEINAGIASVEDIGAFPGASFLFGRTDYYKSGLILDGEIGIAFPSIVTGKLGMGLGNQNAAFLIGIRPFPLTGYAQFNFKLNTGTIIFSAEKSNYRYDVISLNSRGNINLGYRWNLKRKKMKSISNSDIKI